MSSIRLVVSARSAILCVFATKSAPGPATYIDTDRSSAGSSGAEFCSFPVDECALQTLGSPSHSVAVRTEVSASRTGSSESLGDHEIDGDAVGG